MQRTYETQIEALEPGLYSLIMLDDTSTIKLRLFNEGNYGRLLIDMNLTRHNLHRIRDPLNFNPNTGLVLINDGDRIL